MKRIIYLISMFLLACSEDEVDIPNHVPGEVKIVNGKTFVAYGEGGLFITDIATQEVVTQIFPTGKMKSIDDFDVDGNLLFALDARNDNYLAVYNINESKLIGNPILVNGTPFNGISAKSGNLAVSGGTQQLEYFQYSQAGELTGSALFGRDRGHPDVLLSENGQVAFVSTDFQAEPNKPRFGVMALYLGDKLNIPGVLSEHRIAGAGFSESTTQPVGFPIKLQIYKNHLFVAHAAGLTIIELIDNSAFGTANTFNFSIESTAIKVDNDIAYIVGITPNGKALLKIDVTDFANPFVLETQLLNIGSSIPTSLAITNQFVFITAGEEGLLKLSN